MEKIISILKFILSNFGPLVIFYGVNHFYGLKPAIIASIIFIVIEVAAKIFYHQPISTLFTFTAVITLVFGAIDLYAEQSFLFKYEASITNIFTAIFFAYSLVAKKTVIQEFYESKKTASLVTADRIQYFRLLTAVWVGYFLLKAAAYFWIAQNYSLEQGLVIRTVIGSTSFYVLFAISIFGSKKIFPALQKMGWLTSST